MPGGVHSPEDFWRVIRNGEDTITEVPPDRWSIENFYSPDKSRQGRIISKRGGFIDDIDGFDSTFFKVSPKEAASIDPQQRHLLEVVHEAFEDAGILPDKVGESTGVYIGIGMPDYRIQTAERGLIDAYTLTGSSNSVAANRISYTFNLRGPSLAIDTACASSITAMHLACCGIMQDECKVAVVAGCNNLIIPEISIGFSALGVMSPDGKCCPFASSANGYVRSEGCGALILKPLPSAVKDGDHIYAVIRGTAIAANGLSRSLTMPSGAAQEDVIKKAYARCKIPMKDVQYVEAHGTGTPVGDPIEAKAIGKAFAPHRERPLKLGSVKGNFGHNEYASGITSSIKVALMLDRRELCTNINYTDPNPAIDLDKLKLEVQTKPEPFHPDRNMIIGLNSFGFGGAVAHAIFENAPRNRPYISNDFSHADWKFGTDDLGENIIIPLSAKTHKALGALAEEWTDFKCDKDAQKVVSWLSSHRMHHECRLAVICSSGKEFKEKLVQYVDKGNGGDDFTTRTESYSNQPKICMVFPGQGQQWQDMGRKLYATEDVFTSIVNSCDVAFNQLSGWSLLQRTGLFVNPDQYTYDDAPDVDINDTLISQPAILFFQIGLFHLWRHWGVTPDVVVGHSLGEVAAAYACGGLTLDEAVKVIYHRSSQQAKLKGLGSMVAVRLSLLAAKELCSSQENLHVAAVNSPTAITIAGQSKSIDNISNFKNNGTSVVKRLRVESAYHTPNMDKIEKPFKAAMKGVITTESRSQAIKLFSTVTGQLFTDDFDVEYWWDNIRNTVNFQSAIEAILEDEHPDIFLECGASITLLSPIKETVQRFGKESTITIVPSGVRKQDDRFTALRALGIIYTAGMDINWQNVTNDCAEWVSLPTYPWQHQSFWLESTIRRNQRLGQDDRTFHGQNGRISLDVFPFLADHVIEGNLVFPGAGYVEYAIEANVPLTKKICLKFVTFSKMLLWNMSSSENMPTASQLHLECAKEGSKISIAAENTVYSSAVLDATAKESRAVPLAAIRSRCRDKISSQTFYENLSAVGLHYGPAFQVVEEASFGDGEVLGYLRPTPSNKQRIQITHLDGCFQLLISASRSRVSLYVPVAIECICMHVASLPEAQHLVVYATVTDCDTSALTGDVFLAEPDGKVLVEIKGCQCTNMRRKETGIHPKQWLYTTQYQDINSGLPSTQVVSDILSKEQLLKSCHGEVKELQRAEAALPDLRAICASYIKNALNVVVQDDRDHRRQRYISRLEKIATDESVIIIQPEDIPARISSLEEEIPELSTELRLIQELGRILPETLQGQSSATSMLYSTEGLASYFSESRIMHFFYKAGSEAIAKAIREAAQTKHVVRVLQIGGIIGTFTKEVVERLQDLGIQGRLDYTCTYCDLSIFPHPRQKLDAYPFVKFKQFDIDQDPQAKCLVHDSTDVIICFDVLHSTSNVKTKICQLQKILCQGGWLLIYEITNTHHIAELIFGSLDRCWVYDDMRQDTCWLSQKAWVSIMQDMGFHDVRAVSTPEEFMHSIIVGRKRKTEANNDYTHNPEWFLVIENNMTGLKDKLVNNLEEKVNIFQLSQFREVMSQIDDLRMNDAIIVYLWDKSDVNANALTGFLQCLASSKGRIYTKVFVITNGDNVDVAAARGLIRAITNQSSTPIVSIHLEDQACESIDALLGLFKGNTNTPDREILLSSGCVKVPRVMRLDSQDMRTEPSNYWQLVPNRNPTKQPSLNDLSFTSLPDMKPPDDGVVVRVRATSLNFKDVMLVLGMLDGLEDVDDGVHFGIECSGVVVKTGARVTTLRVEDEVVGFGKHCFASHTITDAQLLVPKPQVLGWSECAGISVIFTTAYYSLVERANVRSDETVLIHSACGGVGLAAIQVARMIGCKIICSAGTSEKRKFLEEQMGVDMVTDSRSLQFYDDVMAWTTKRGVDVVLNSLHGELLMKGIELLAPGGRFCEIGKRDILQHSTLQMNLLLENKSLLSCQIDRLIKLQPNKVRDVLLKVVSLFENGTFVPVVTMVRSIENHLAAFSAVAKGGHIGKFVFEVPNDFKPNQLIPSSVLFKDNATYIVTGGHGGLGLALARWLCNKGARHIVLVSLHGCQSANSKRTVSYLRKQNAMVYNFAIDISDENDVRAMFCGLRNELQAPPCVGIFHLAGVITGESLSDLTPDLMGRFMGAKAFGAQHLHNLSIHEPLDVFFMMSSSVALWGNSSQPGYVAANSYLDALAEDRRAKGLPALSLQLGSVTGAGYLETNLAPLRALEKKGQLSLDVNTILHCMKHLFQRKWLPPVVCLTNQVITKLIISVEKK